MLLISRVNEFPNTVNISPGSRIIFPNTKEYILNNHNEWVPIHMMAFEIKNDLVSEDLNSIENFGIYHQNNTSNAKLTKNYPSESAGVLKVYKSNDFVYQEYTVLSGQINENKTYVRSKYVGVWSNWVAPTYISDSEWNTIKNNSHSHSNKTLLDSLNNAQVNNWNKAYSWNNHATQGYIKISDTDTKYVPFIGDSKIKGSLIIQNKETYNNFLPGAFTLTLNFNKVTLNNFGIYQNLDNEVNPNYWIGYKDNNNIEKKFVEFNLNQNKFTLGKSAPIYIDTFQLSSINQVSYLTLDNSGKIGKIDGLPLSNFTETDPTVPSFVKAISNQQILNWNNITENYKNYIDDRIIEPNSISTNKLQFGFTSWDNNNSNPYADFLHFGGYQGATSGNQNLILFNKNNFGLRQYQKTSQSTEPYISFVDYWNTNNFKQVDINNWNEAHSWGNHAGLYASVAHSHTIANINNLQTTLDGKVDLVSAQTITSVKNFQNGFDINSYQFRGLNSNVLTIGKNVFGNSLSKIVDSSIAVGNNVFPSMNLQPFDPVTEYYKGYVGIGSDIFIDYTGDSNYRPDHNAHDSWVGFGRGLGAGFLDGTNVTLVGTGLLGKNDVKYADCVTIIGKGFTNGIKTRGTKTLDPNRVVPSKNGYNVHGMMSDVIGMGHENWIEDINQSVVIGSNLRPYTYVFNSLVLGHHHLNMNFEGTTEQADMYLDSDVIIGMGVGKRSSRHAPSHNLLIGMDYFYSTGGAPNANYRPLIEGRFKDDAQLQVNGTIIGGFEKLDNDLPYLERVTFESVSLPSGVVYNASERSFTFNGKQASTSITLHNVPTNPNKYIYIEISSSNHTVGSWGYSVYDAVDSGNGPTENYVARQTFKTTSPTAFILTTEGNFKGTIHIICDYTDVTLRSINPNILLKDSKERKTFEIRTTQDPSIVSMGLNSGKFLTHGGKTLILGNDILSETPAATNNVLVGSNIFKFGTNLGNNVVLGNEIGGNNTNLAHSVVIGNGNLQSNFTNNVARLTIVGHGAGKALTAGTHNNLFGEIAGVSLTTGSSNAFFGSASGLIKEGSNNTFIGHTAGGYGLMQSTVNNTIVIGANATPEVPNNTTTIATASNTDNFLYGTTHSNAFKVRGGTGTRVLLDDGSTKLLAEIEGSTDLSNYVTLNTTQSISGTKTFTSTIVGSINGNAATATKLTTTRTINGTSFDGSANITTAQWGTGRNITIGNTTKSVNGSTNVSWSLAEIGAAPSTDVVTLTTNQTIGSEKLFTTILKVGNSWGSDRGLHFRLGNADNATIEGCNGDISSWWGIGLGHHYTGNYVRTIAINARSGNITANSFIKSGGTATQVLMADGSVKNQSDFGGSYTLPTATTSVLGGIKLSSDTVQTVASNTTTATAGRTYASQVNANGQLVINVPWTDNNTTYSAGSNLTLTGTTFAVNSSPTFSGSVTAGSFIKSGGTATQVLMANGSVKEQQTFLNLDSDGHAINLNQDTDFNTITKTGFYRCDTGTNAPSGKSWYHIMIESHENGGGWCKQTATSYSTGGIENGITFTRVNVGGSWQPWKRLITDTDNAGINLLVASKNWSKNWVSNNVVTIASIIYNGLAVSKATAAWAYFYQSYNFEVGKTYTLSAYVMCPNNNAINCGIYLFDNWSLDFGAVPSSWKRVSKTFTVTSAMVGSSTNRNVRIESGSSSDANPLYLAGMKLEESNFPSPWSMNPADIVDTYSPQTIDGNKTFTDTTYFPKARIQTDGNIVTDSFGNSFQWNQAHTWGNHATAGYLKTDTALVAGFVNGNSQFPYMRHNDQTVVELASKNWVNGQGYAYNNGSNASNTWQNDSFGLTLNPLIPGKTLNASGQNVSLKDATYGSVAGILQDSTNGPIAGVWTNRLKILHNNTEGYYTELAHSFTGVEGVWHRRNVAGTVSPWRQLYDNTIWSASTLNYSGNTLTLTINGISKSTTINAGNTYTAGSNIGISGNTISVSSTPSFTGVNVNAPNGALQIRSGNGDGASIATCNADIGSWWGIGFGYTYTGGYVRTIAIDTRNGTITAASFLESSLKKYKTNIKPFKKCGLKMIRELDIVTFDRIDGVKNKIGIIADNTKKEFLSEELDAVDLYKTVFIQAKAIQELEKKNNRLEEELNNLRELVMSKLNQL